MENIILFLKAAAPDDILHVVRCNCRTETKNPCGGNTCSCRKNGLTCVSACGSCHGRGCRNEAAVDFEEDTGTSEELIDNNDNIFDLLF